MNINKANRIKLAKLLSLVAETKCDDGTILYTEGELTVDAEVFVNEDGNMVPAPDGEYNADGKTIVVASGKVTEIKEAEAEPVTVEDPVPEEPVAEETADEEAPATEEAPTEEPEPETDDVEALKARIAELEAENETLKSENEDLKKKLEESVDTSIEDQEKKEKKFAKEKKETTLTGRLIDFAQRNQ